jgi:hypothetical protein
MLVSWSGRIGFGPLVTMCTVNGSTALASLTEAR